MQELDFFRQRKLVVALFVALTLAACGGGTDDTAVAADAPLVVPDAPKGLGVADSAPVQDASKVKPFVDNVLSNQRGDARYATLETNAGVRVAAGFLDVWTPSTLIVDAGQTAPAVDGFPAVAKSTWSGIPGDASDGKVKNQAVHDANIAYVVKLTTNRSADQELAAYLDDRRQKAYSISDGMGPLTAVWRAAAQQTTTITGIPADAGSKKYDDGGNNAGESDVAKNPDFSKAVSFVGGMGGAAGSTEPAKRFYKYARPYRWDSKVVVAPSLEPAKSSSPATDGGFLSGHTAEAVRGSIGMAYLVPERFQEMLARGLELGENRILGGMHSPLDVIGGRLHGMAVATSTLVLSDAKVRSDAYTQAHATLMQKTGTATWDAFYALAKSGTAANDRFADYASTKTQYLRRMTFGFTPIGNTGKAAVVPKGAEILLETRLPYLSAEQRRVVLKTTALPSGYPILDDAEGWGRLNLFAAADGYGRFDGDVILVMNASQGGFNALDSWKNDIAGKGKLSKDGTGTLVLSGNNSWSGGTEVRAGFLQADSATAFGTGDLYVRGGAGVIVNAAKALSLANYTQLVGANLSLRLGSGEQGQLNASGTVTIAGGSLNLSFASGNRPKVGDTIKLIGAGSLAGRFDQIVAEGYKLTPIYSKQGLSVRIDA